VVSHLRPLGFCMVRLYVWSGRRCFSHCDVFECSTGNVSACPFHGHVNGRDTPRKVGGSSLSLIQIWALGKRKGGGCFG
jgi:hypothetical protein